MVVQPILTQRISGQLHTCVKMKALCLPIPAPAGHTAEQQLNMLAALYAGACTHPDIPCCTLLVRNLSHPSSYGENTYALENC